MKKISSIVIFIGLLSRLCFAEGVLVYIPTTAAVSKVEKKVSGLTSEKVTAFAKYSDFEAAIETMKPDVIITTEALPMSVEGYTPVSGLKINGSDKSKYMLLALDASWKGKKLAEARLGAVEFIKRNKMKDYFNKLFGVTFQSVKTVSKVEDLFPLLVFKSVDVIALQPNSYEELKEKFNTAVSEVGTSSDIQPITLYQKTAADSKKPSEELKTLDFNNK